MHEGRDEGVMLEGQRATRQRSTRARKVSWKGGALAQLGQRSMPQRGMEDKHRGRSSGPGCGPLAECIMREAGRRHNLGLQHKRSVQWARGGVSRPSEAAQALGCTPARAPGALPACLRVADPLAAMVGPGNVLARPHALAQQAPAGPVAGFLKGQAHSGPAG